MAALFYKNFLKAESNFVSLLQTVIDVDNTFLTKLSRYCETSYAVGILFPVFASVDTKLGYQVLLVSSASEWTSTILKWVFAEDRPYWWVQEAKVNVKLQHSELTCETGPGSPSGHVMGCAALQYVFLHWLINWCHRTFSNEWSNLRKFTVILFSLVYILFVTLISVARINIAAHFPHQCIFGAVLGYLLAKFLVNETKSKFAQKVMSLTKLKAFSFAVLISIVSAFAYSMHHLLGYDPGWSIKLAFKWCRKPDRVSVYTTPIYSLVRDCGCFFGVGLASPIKERKFYPIVGAIVTTLFFVGTRLLKPMMPSNDPFQFYLFHFLDNLFITLSLMTFVPYIASLVKVKDKTE